MTVRAPFGECEIDTQAPATMFPTALCESCLNPLILCQFHPEPVPYYGEPGPFWLYSEEMVRINPADADGGAPSTAETFRPIVGSAKQIAASSSRRNTDSGRFRCTLCSQDFTAPIDPFTRPS